MIRAIAFCAGLALAGAAQAQSLPTVTYGGLCINGHPAKRSPYVTYGHVHCPPGTVRDHETPLCGGGPDTADNIQCQEREESYRKDEEERMWCEDMCRGKDVSGKDVSKEDLQRHFREKWGGKP